jgi:hypothetical protein
MTLPLISLQYIASNNTMIMEVCIGNDVKGNTRGLI